MKNSSEMDLLVNEIFASIQGEGPRIGQVVTFIRLGGCTLQCDWCDTKYAFQEGEVMDIETLVSKVVGKPGHIVWTGGEPMEQLRSEHLVPFGDYKRTFSLETNGTRYDPALARRMDIIAVSPKPRRPWEKNAGKYGMDDYYLEHITHWVAHLNTYLKFVIDTQPDETAVQEQLSQVMRIVKRVEYDGRPIYLQPMDHGGKVFISRKEEYYQLYSALINRGVFADQDICVLPQLHKWVKLR